MTAGLAYLVNHLGLEVHAVHGARIHGSHEVHGNELANQRRDGGDSLDVLHKVRGTAVANLDQLLVQHHQVVQLLLEHGVLHVQNGGEDSGGRLVGLRQTYTANGSDHPFEKRTGHP